MARRKQDEPLDGPARQGEGRAGLVELGGDFRESDEGEAGEKVALKARIAELEAQLAAPPAPFVAPPGATGEYWTVKLMHCREHTVRAKDAANAWMKFCEEMGVISSEYKPEIFPADRAEYHAAQARRYNRKPEEFRLPDGG